MKVLRHIINLISTLMIIALLVLTILLVGVRLVGLTPYAVLSGSMEPTYHVGSLIYVKEVDPATITVGTPITFVVNEDLLVATHRVIEVEAHTTRFEQVKDENGNPLYEDDGDPLLEEVPLDEPAYYFTTKGDANDVVDGSQVYYKNVIGTPMFSVPYLGYFSNWLQTRKGMVVAISAVLILMILTFLPDLLRMADDPAPKKKKKKKGKPGAKKRRPQQSVDDKPRSKKPRPDGERRPLTEEERAALAARRKARARAAQQAQAAALPQAPVKPQEPAAQQAEPAAQEPILAAEGEEAPAPRRRRRRQPPSADAE